jgi:phosphatidylglycerol:prolipoprotein diacylglycerol transferase
MHPVLFKIGPLTIYTYGAFIVIALLIGMWIVKCESTKVGLDSNKMMDIYFYGIIGGLIGARIFYVFLFWRDFWPQIWKIFMLWEGGVVFYGAVFGAVPVCIFLVRRYKFSLRSSLDILVFPLPLAHSIGRIGCFMAGCCYGKDCSLPWAVVFRTQSSLAPLNIPIHPTQLYSSFTNLIIFILLILIKKRKQFDGQILSAYLCLYPIGRAINEIFRGDKRSIALCGFLNLNHLINLAMLICGILLYSYLKSMGKENN